MLYLKQSQLERLSADKAAQQILIERELQQVCVGGVNRGATPAPCATVWVVMGVDRDRGLLPVQRTEPWDLRLWGVLECTTS